MLYLLTETSIFVSLPNQCLCQMTGEPLIHIVPLNSGTLRQRLELQEPQEQVPPAMKRKAVGRHEDERPTKRLRIYESVSSFSTAQPTIRYVSNILDLSVPLFILAQSCSSQYLFSSHATFFMLVQRVLPTRITSSLDCHRGVRVSARFLFVWPFITISIFRHT
jgi:hypothetical protein